MTYFMMALALVLGFTQCKKEQVPANNESEGVRITLTVDGGNNGSKVIVDPNAPQGYATVIFESGDIIYVGNNGAYVGYLTYDGTNFSGSIDDNNLNEADYLHFYFMGNKGTTSQPTEAVSITDQTSKYPVISYAPSTKLYKSGVTSYTAKLQNYCAIVKFITNNIPVETDITVKGMQNTVSVNFGANNAAAATPTLGNNPYTPGNSGTGDIILHAESPTERWAILLEQDAVNDATVSASGYNNGTCNVPAITNNMYYITGGGVNISMPPTLTTGAVTLAGSGATPNVATGKVTLTYAGSVGEVTEVGVCWGTSQNPTITDSHAAAAGQTVGTEYMVNMGNLEAGTTYYIRSYVKVGDSDFYGDEVSVKSYYLISTLENWNEFAAVVNYGTDATARAIQMANISGVTTVVGNSDHPFKGSYNGQGYTISNVAITEASEVGLFGTVNSASAVIKNVVVASGTVSGTNQNVGAIVGKLIGGTVTHCANYAEVTSTLSSGNVRIGGIVGWMTSDGGTNNHVDSCINYGNIHARAYVGGIVGTFGAGSLTYCQNYGPIEATGAYTAGGIAGWNYSTKYVPAYNHSGGDITTSNAATYQTNNYLISNRNENSINYYNNHNTYLTSLTLTIAGTDYTGSGLEQFVPNSNGPAALTSNPAGITIGNKTYSWNTPAP